MIVVVASLRLLRPSRDRDHPMTYAAQRFTTNGLEPQPQATTLHRVLTRLATYGFVAVVLYQHHILPRNQDNQSTCIFSTSSTQRCSQPVAQTLSDQAPKSSSPACRASRCVTVRKHHIDVSAPCLRFVNLPGYYRTLANRDTAQMHRRLRSWPLRHRRDALQERWLRLR
jgi:hypothetical protein